MSIIITEEKRRNGYLIFEYGCARPFTEDAAQLLSEWKTVPPDELPWVIFFYPHYSLVSKLGVPFFPIDHSRTRYIRVTPFL